MKRYDINDRISAAQSLLELLEDGNRSQFCEPHTGTFTSTDMYVNNIDALEEGSVQKLRDENVKLLRECHDLKQKISEG